MRDSYVADDRRTIVVDRPRQLLRRVVGTIPLKGQVLNQIAAFWFEKTRALAPNHLLVGARPVASRSCASAGSLPVEFVVRGYLTGVDQHLDLDAPTRRATRSYCGHRLPDGLRKHEPLPDAARSRRPRRRRAGRARRAHLARGDRRERRAHARSSTSAPRRMRCALFARRQRSGRRAAA